MMPFNPWLNMGTAQAAPSQPFPGRMPPPVAPPQAMPAEMNWQPQIGQLEGFTGPPQPPPAELAQAQASIESQAQERAALEQVGGMQAAANAPDAGVPRETRPDAGAAPITTSSLQDMIANLNKRELKSLESQGLTVKKLKESLATLEGAELPTDLTPLAALTDTWTGSNFAQTYKPAETLKDRRGAVERLQAQIAQSENGLSNNEIDMLKSQLGSQFQLEGMDYKKQQDKIQNGFKAQELANDRAKIAKSGALNGMDAFQMRTTIDKLDTTKAIRGNIELAHALNNYEKLVDKYGQSPTGVPSSELDNAYSAITLAYKNAGELGALSGPDMGIVEQGVGRAGGIGGWLKTEAKGGATGIKAQIKAMRNATKAGFDRRFQGMGELIQGYEPVAGDYVGSFGKQMNEAMGSGDLQNKSRAEKEAELARLKAAKAARAGKGQ